jgi:hypothetical protein
MEDNKAKKKTQFIIYLTILNHENRLLNIGPICPKPFEDIQFRHTYMLCEYRNLIMMNNTEVQLSNTASRRLYQPFVT